MADNTAPMTTLPSPWNKGRLIGQKPPLKLREVWTVRTRLQMAGNTREIALFNLAIDSMLHGCDLVRLMVRGLAHGTLRATFALVGHRRFSGGSCEPGAGYPCPTGMA